MLYYKPLHAKGPPTHILALDLGPTFFQAALYVRPLVSPVVPQAADELVQGFFEHGRGLAGYDFAPRTSLRIEEPSFSGETKELGPGGAPRRGPQMSLLCLKAV